MLVLSFLPFTISFTMPRCKEFYPHMTQAHRLSSLCLILLLPVLITITGCRTPAPGRMAKRTGDEIIVAGQLVHTGTRVVTWMDPGGYDGYRVERRFSPLEKADWENSKNEVKDLTTPNRYNLRRAGLTDEEIERVRGGGWDLPTLQKVVDQFVLHYDVCGTSRQCFRVLHDMRGLSVHFMLDIDGTIYQTLDLKERAWHATTSNTRSVGIEIANMGAYPTAGKNPFDTWYGQDDQGRTRITIPERLGDGGVRTPDFIGYPARNEPVRGEVQGKELVQYDFTPEQYEALIKLTAALSAVFPKIKCDYPRDEAGKLITRKLPDEQLTDLRGVIGHFHIQTNKVDPGPAFQWDYVLGNARKLLNGGMSPAADATSRGHLRRQK
jgi:N-acetylmuramoyl-L-alanine amidase